MADKHYISDSMPFDIWCWREATPAILKRIVQQLANIGVNYTTIEADGWMGERTPEENYKLQVTPFKPNGGAWDLSKPNPEWDARLWEFVTLCNKNNIIVQLQLFTQQYDHWRNFMPWTKNCNKVSGLWPCTDFHRNYVNRAVVACAGLDARYSAGCELSGNPDMVAKFHLDVLEIPFMRGKHLDKLLLGVNFAETFVRPANFSGEAEQIKAKFDKLWMPKHGAYGKDTTAYFIRKYAHGVYRLNVNGGLDIGISYHAPYATQWEFSTDGDWGGASPTDKIVHQGRVDVKPSKAQMYALSAKLFEAFRRPIVIDSFHEGQYDGTTGRPVMERLIDMDKFGLLDNTRGAVGAYEVLFGKLKNHGAVIDPYVEPTPPEPISPTPIPPTPAPVTPHPAFNLKGWWCNNKVLVIGIIIFIIVLIKVLI